PTELYAFNIRPVRLGPTLNFSACQFSAFSLILFIRNLFHPVDRLAVQRFLNSDMSHRGRRCRAVPMLLAGCKPDHITWPNFLDRAALALHPAEAGRDDQRLAEWMGMPGGAGTRLERDAR